MTLDDWAAKWAVPQQAVAELRASWIDPVAVTPQPGSSEAAVQTLVRLEATSAGARLWRNNNGAGYMQDGSFIRWGLANESDVMSRNIKSSDLIGITPVHIKAEHVGRMVGVFTAREIKRASWTYAGTERERAQLAFLKLVTAFGGDACFATGPGTIRKNHA
jgi:hypothetical protein